jgi:hypothetical protein
MKIEIDYKPYENVYVWKLWDGPDGIDFYDGVELNIGQCFESIIVKRTFNAQHYDTDRM